MKKLKESKGLLHLYYGDGAGKTTAAIGLAVRAAGHGKHVLVVQFLKEATSGEVTALQKLGHVDVITGQNVPGFVFQMNETEKRELRQNMQQHWQAAVTACQINDYALLVLDEVLDAIALGMLSENQLLSFLEKRPETLEVVLTGHEEYPLFLEKADYVTEMKKHKHPYEKGVLARKGIEW